MRADLPPVKDQLSGLRATLRDNDKVLVIQGSVAGKTYLNLNGKFIWVETDKLLQAVNRVAEANSPEKGEE